MKTFQKGVRRQRYSAEYIYELTFIKKKVINFVANYKTENHMTCCQPSFKCSETGISVFKDFIFLAASPIGVCKLLILC